MRMLVMLLLTRADFYKLKDLMVEYRFFLSAEDEIRLENGNQNLNRNQAVNNFMQLLNSNDDNEENKKTKTIYKKMMTICGMEKREVC